MTITHAEFPDGTRVPIGGAVNPNLTVIKNEQPDNADAIGRGIALAFEALRLAATNSGVTVIGILPVEKDGIIFSSVIYQDDQGSLGVAKMEMGIKPGKDFWDAIKICIEEVKRLS